MNFSRYSGNHKNSSFFTSWSKWSVRIKKLNALDEFRLNFSNDSRSPSALFSEIQLRSHHKYFSSGQKYTVSCNWNHFGIKCRSLTCFGQMECLFHIICDVEKKCFKMRCHGDFRDCALETQRIATLRLKLNNTTTVKMRRDACNEYEWMQKRAHKSNTKNNEFSQLKSCKRCNKTALEKHLILRLQAAFCKTIGKIYSM